MAYAARLSLALPGGLLLPGGYAEHRTTTSLAGRRVALPSVLVPVVVRPRWGFPWRRTPQRPDEPNHSCSEQEPREDGERRMHLNKMLIASCQNKGGATMPSKAKARAADLMSIIMPLQERGITSAAGLAKALNAMGDVTAPRGGQWQATQVQRCLRRAAGA